MAIQPVVNFYISETTFTTANPGIGFQSFESVEGRGRSGSPVSTPGFTVTPLGPALLGVQTGPEAPEPGFGSGATHGSRYLFSYLAGQPPGTFRFDFQTPTLAFGLHLVDLGETPGEIRLDTDNSGLPSPHVAYSFGTPLNNGSVLFAGIARRRRATARV